MDVSRFWPGHTKWEGCITNTHENNCSNKYCCCYPRFDHILISNGGVAQRGADLDRVNMAKEQLELVYVELQPGDVVFFHCNLLHTSAQNLSDMRRWSMICAYNSRWYFIFRLNCHIYCSFSETMIPCSAITIPITIL